MIAEEEGTLVTEDDGTRTLETYDESQSYQDDRDHHESSRKHKRGDKKGNSSLQTATAIDIVGLAWFRRGTRFGLSGNFGTAGR